MIKYTSTLAENYNAYHKQSTNLFQLQLEKIKHYLDLKPETDILVDAGCGAGRLLLELVPFVKNIIGVEYSANMYNELKSSQKYNEHINTISLYNMDFNSFMGDTINYNKVIFSYSLHQITPNKNQQIDILKKLVNSGKDVLLITQSHNQFSKNVLNQISEELHTIDVNRYLDISELEQNFKLGCIEECTINRTINKNVLLDLVESDYISTLQLVSQSEKSKIISQINDMPNDINYPDFYTYILIPKQS